MDDYIELYGVVYQLSTTEERARLERKHAGDPGALLKIILDADPLTLTAPAFALLFAAVGSCWPLMLRACREEPMRTCDAAVLVLRETDNPAVMWGDEGLCHLIANRAQLATVGRAWRTSDRVLTNLSRQPGDLVAGTTTTGSGRRVRCFWLPEHAPKQGSAP